MKISRLFEIVYILLDKKTVTAKELASHFEVSVRTIYRDIDTLSSSGIPVYTSQGKGGGIALLEDFVLNKSVLSEQEQQQILIALQNLSATQYPDLDDMLSRLSSLFQQKNNHWIEVDFSPWGSNEEHKEKFNLLRLAITESRVIKFAYFNSAGVKSLRHAEPVQLVFKHRAWYLIAYQLEKKAYRTFKVTRINDVEMTNELFETRLEPPAHIDSGFAGSLIPIELRVSPLGAFRIYDEFYEKDVVQNEDGSFTVTTSFPDGEWLYHYLLSFGATLLHIEPQSVRDTLLSKIKALEDNLTKG